nr:tRNA (uridine(54)-C5)-methyltransferase TrmA [uncultured Campylobacter sp.]
MPDKFCKFLGECGSCTLDMPYEEQVKFKTEFIRREFEPFYSGEFEFSASQRAAYRTRAEFGIWRDGDELRFTMHGAKTKRIMIDECPKVAAPIANLMPRLLEALMQNQILKERLFGAEFISCASGILATLLYHKRLGKAEQGEIESLAREFADLRVTIAARAKGQKLLSGELNLLDNLNIGGKIYKFTFGDGAFIQPNTAVNEKMIAWAKGCVERGADLLELYCGHGNFTVPMAEKFKRVLATEISKSSIANALKNCELNGVDNIKFLRMSAEELMSAFGREREFNRLRELDIFSYDFSHVLVDPPRAGLDDSVINFIKNYENIIYISCSPQSLKRDLAQLALTHEAVKFAVFDQFANTAHIECGVLLRSKNA